jgi:predicted nucleic acid-binding protein
MNYLVDSDWVADYLKDKPQAIAFLDSLSEAGIAISLITYGEMYEGIYYGGSATRASKASRPSCAWCWC